jgi:hypothetical protein
MSVLHCKSRDVHWPDAHDSELELPHDVPRYVSKMDMKIGRGTYRLEQCCLEGK